MTSAMRLDSGLLMLMSSYLHGAHRFVNLVLVADGLLRPVRLSAELIAVNNLE